MIDLKSVQKDYYDDVRVLDMVAELIHYRAALSEPAQGLASWNVAKETFPHKGSGGRAMIDKRTGGPAFPFVFDDALGPNIFTGMTLRDYFAAKAMQAMLGWDDERINWPSYAKQAYELADSMLEAREK